MSDAPRSTEEASIPSSTDGEEDADIRMLKARRMLELRKRANMNTVKKSLEEQRLDREKNRPSDRDILLKALRDRGDEVLSIAEVAYPKEMAILISRLAALIKQGKVSTITG